MRKLLITLVMFSTLSAKYLVRVDVTGVEDVKRLLERGVDLAATIPQKSAVDVIVDDLDILEGYSFILLEAQEPGIKRNFGPYYTYSEAVQELDRLHTLYPDIVSEKFSIGQSIEGRELWAIRISDNPEVDEDEPAVFLNAAIHAREPGGVSTVFGFIHYLVRNYGSDPTVTWLINNRELYIEPVVNPDGYVYNEFSDGWWRKNKRDNNHNGRFEESEDGVDLNRNFGYMWGYDDIGSSPNPSSQTYRGTGPFSEPETDYMRIFADSIRPRIVINYHTYSNLVIYPWGYENQPTPDENVFIAMSQRMTEVNGYEYGRPAQLLYPVNGEANDWFYGDTIQKPRALSFVVEVGESFWQPDTNVILEQINENIPLNMFVLKAAGLYFELSVDSVINQNGNPSINPGDTILVYLSLTNLSPFDAGENVELTASVDTLAGQVITSTVPVGNIGTFPDGNVSCETPIRIALSNQVRSGMAIDLAINVNASGGFQQPFKLVIPVGEPQVMIYEDFEEALTDWTTTGTWGLTSTRYHSPAHSLTDSPNGNYSNNQNTYAQYTHPIDLSGLRSATITFYTTYQIENGWDFVYFEVSTDGVNWQSLKSYTGVSSSWTLNTIDLSSFIPDTIYIRFHFESDGSVTRDGFYVDDIRLSGFRPVGVSEQIPVKNLTFNLKSNIFVGGSNGRIQLSLPARSSVKISIYDISGRLVSSIPPKIFSEGFHEIPLPGNFKPGLYFVVLNAEEQTFVRKILITGR